MAHWLVKSEPETWSWDDQTKKGEKGTHWDGVRNFQAANNLKAMKIGDLALFYHSGEERAVVGIVQVTKSYRPDPSDETGRFGMVDVKAYKALPQAVTLAQIKAEPKLKDIALVRQGRLSVSSLEADEFDRICRMGGLTRID